MKINTVTVIGANGTMGRNVAGIFASFGNAKVYMVCRRLVDAKEAKMKAAISVRAEAINKNLIPKIYDELRECIMDSDLIFESVTESFEVKKYIYKLISDFVKEGTIIGTGTSGLSINKLSQSFSAKNKKFFLGIHMYNPPYNMTLCEVVPSEMTEKEVIIKVKDYLKNVLYREVVEVKDEPAFMGNRIGFQFINEALQCAEKYKMKGGIDYIDAILGGFTGRSMPPLVTGDFVGLDVHKAIVDNIYENTNDYEHLTFILPDFAQKLIDENKLGSKSGEGLYKKTIKKDGQKIFDVFDIYTQEYRPIRKYKFEFVQKVRKNLLKGNYKSAMDCLINDTSKEADICMQLLIKYVLYGIYITKKVGEDIHSVDHVMATGFGWIPPLALIDAINCVSSFEKEVRKKMPKEFLETINLEYLLKDIEKSTYDYRPFFKAK